MRDEAVIHPFPAAAIVRRPNPQEPKYGPTQPDPQLLHMQWRREQRLDALRLLMRQSRDKALTFGGLAVFALSTGGATVLSAPANSAVMIAAGVSCTILAAAFARNGWLAHLDYRQQRGAYKRVPISGASAARPGRANPLQRRA